MSGEYNHIVGHIYCYDSSSVVLGQIRGSKRLFTQKSIKCKGIDHPNMKILWFMSCISYLNDFLSFVKHKSRCDVFGLFHTMNINSDRCCQPPKRREKPPQNQCIWLVHIGNRLKRAAWTFCYMQMSKWVNVKGIVHPKIKTFDENVLTLRPSKM